MALERRHVGRRGSSNYKSTPLLDDGVLDIPWVNNGMAAVDAGTGKTLWTFEPQPAEIGGGLASPAGRSLAYWTDGTDKRVFHNSGDGRLIAVDGKTGKPAPGFGKNGLDPSAQGIVEGTPRPMWDRCRQLWWSERRGRRSGDRVGIAQQGERGGQGARVRCADWPAGLDVQSDCPTGRVGRRHLEGDGSGKYSGAAGVWSMMSADPELGLVYLPTETPTNEFYGGQRPGDGLFGESIVAVDAKTGKHAWHDQIVHHGLWDYDMPAAPILHDIRKDGKTIKALTSPTKQGLTFVFDRKTGEPVWPIEERPVPKSPIPGEHASPTEPFPTLPEPFLRLGYSEDDLIDFTPALREAGRKSPRSIPRVNSTPRRPRSRRRTRARGSSRVLAAGRTGLARRSIPDTHIMYTPLRLKPQFAGIKRGDPKTTNMDYYGGGGGLSINGPQGLPILKPPYSVLVATDMNTGKHLWRIPIGEADDFVKNNPALKGLNLDFAKMGKFHVRPSPLLTKELLVPRRVRETSAVVRVAPCSGLTTSAMARWCGRQRCPRS